MGAVSVLAIYFVWRWIALERGHAPAPGMSDGRAQLAAFLRPAIGFVTNFFDTLGIGSFAPTTSIYKFMRLVPDENIPGTLNVGHALPTVVQALIYTVIIKVDPTTLIAMIVAAILGAWLGAGIVARMPRRAIQLGMGIALIAAAMLFVYKNLGPAQGEGTALALHGPTLVIAIAGNFVLGALMTLGIGLYAPCFILVSLLGMDTRAAFPIMMGSCAFLMPVAGLKFITSRRYDLRAAIGLALGGIPAVLIAAFIVRDMNVVTLRWLVVIVVLIAALMMLWSALKAPEPRPVPSAPTP